MSSPQMTRMFGCVLFAIVFPPFVGVAVFFVVIYHLRCTSELQGLFLRRSSNQSNPQVARRRVNRLRHPGRRPVTSAIVRCAKVRPTLHHLARNLDLRLRRVVAGLTVSLGSITAATT